VKALVLELFEPQNVRDSKLTFEGLAFTQLMKDTFWSRKEFLLFPGLATKPKGGQYWFADKAALENQMDMNTIVVDANKYQDLSFEKCVARKFEAPFYRRGVEHRFVCEAICAQSPMHQEQAISPLFQRDQEHLDPDGAL